MGDASPFLKELQASLDAIEAALIHQDADATEALCHQFHQLLSGKTKNSMVNVWSSPADIAAISNIDGRMKNLRTTLVQQAALTQRSLSTLLPERSVATYGGKTAFGTAAHSANLKSYQA